MPQIQYPFIDIAVHPAVRARFAAGEAIVLFSQDMAQVLWANGEGARLFGHDDIYDLLDNGPDRAGVAFRQLAATARQLQNVGDRRGLVMRVNSGFASQAISGDVSLVEVRQGETVVIFSAPIAANATFQARISAMLKGFDDPDTHMAVIDDQGAVLAASPGYEALGILPEAARSLIAAAARSNDGLIKRPVASAAGYLPAAVGKLSQDPPLNLLFCVETVLGRMDPPQEIASVPEAEAGGMLATADDELEAVGPDSVASVETPADPGASGEDHEAASLNLELASDEADATGEIAEEISKPVHGEEDIPENLQLAVDEAEVSADTDPVPEDAIPYGVEAPSIAAAEMAPEQALPESDELAADEAETASIPETDELDGEPEDHVEADMAEAALNEGEEAEEVAALAELDGVAPTELETYASAEGAPAARPDAASGETPESATLSGQKEISGGGPSADDSHVPHAPFEFRRDGRPVRFVWKLDAQGRFAEVSEEFARTVGPHAGDINGMSYRDLNSLFNLDPGNEIGALLERRDTWSGRTIRWPVEGTDLVVPVDLAALPTYTRNREFDGFRGFGIIRVGDAEHDPNETGLTLGREPQQEPAPEELMPEELMQATEPAGEILDTAASSDEEVPLTIDGQFAHLHADEAHAADQAGETAAESEDEFRGETPALKVESNPLASFSEKIVQLEERRARARDGLTPNEQNAFREIARQLEPFGKRPNDTLSERPDETSGGEISDETASAGAKDDFEAPVVPEAGATSPSVVTEQAEERQTFVETGTESEIAASGADVMPAAQGVEPSEDRSTDGIGLTASAADQIPVAMLIHAGDRLIHANAEFKRFSGYESLDALQAAGGLDALISRREGPESSVCMVRSDGGQVPVSARLQSVRYEGAKLLMLTLLPVEAETSAQDALAEDQEAARKLSALKVEIDELRSILETATDGVVVLDTDGRIRSMNRSASALFNFEDSETRGKPFAMLFAHESQKAVQDYLGGLAGHGVASVLNDGREVIGREASGGFIPLFMTMGRMPGSNSYCAVMRDITQWKRSEEELKTAKRAAETANQHKSDFLARVSHEIRTPLNAIIGFADMIASEHFGPAGHPRYVEYANDIGRSGRHVLDIVNDLLDISKIEAGEMDLEFAAVGINDCVSEAVSLVQQQANSQRVIIRTSLSQSVPDVVADLRSIKQIAINILANAIRFTPSGGQIVVSTAYEPNGSVTLRIRDTGIGMSKSELEQAMRPFGQVSPGARKRGDGTGLGLPLTKAMTEANRALFSIQSAPSEGTLVEIVFPPQRVLAD